jgi:phosphatidylinositol kinase/protein kinase (PI-3  family)
MVHALTAIRKRKSLILDTCEIFVKEPLLDWVKDAKMKISEEESKVDSQAESAFDIEMD